MPRKPRQIIPGLPHHIVQRGVQRVRVFHKPNDYKFYLDLLTEWSKQASLDVWAYCLMPNHVHLIAVPQHEDSLRLALSQTHRRYTSMINKREESSGHLWQGRFLSYPIDNDPYLLSAVRYVEMNPVMAKIVEDPFMYPWSSAALRNGLHSASLLKGGTILKELIPDWRAYLSQNEHASILQKIAAQSGDSYF